MGDIEMKKRDFLKLKEGDTIVNKFSNRPFIVMANYGETGIIASFTLLACNPSEWDLAPPAEKPTRAKLRDGAHQRANCGDMFQSDQEKGRAHGAARPRSGSDD